MAKRPRIRKSTHRGTYNNNKVVAMPKGGGRM